MDMIETNVSQLKAKIGKFMREVRAGRQVVIKDRKDPIARLVPYRPDAQPKPLLIVKHRDPGAPPLGEVRVKPIVYSGISSTELLREDRARR